MGKEITETETKLFKCTDSAEIETCEMALLFRKQRRRECTYFNIMALEWAVIGEEHLSYLLFNIQHMPHMSGNGTSLLSALESF